MYVKTFIYTALLCSTFLVRGQYADVGGSVMAASYLGDLTPPQNLFIELNAGLGVYGRYNISRHFAFRGQLTVGRVSGDDENSNFSSGRLQRNLNFRSRIWEAAVLSEVNLLPFDPTAKKRPLIPYAFMGVAFFHFRPKAQYSFEWIDLQPLSTEGQGFAEYPDRQPYQLWQWSIPFGGGIKLALKNNWVLGVEVGLRKTFTDYLDDVSTTYPDRELVRAYKGDIAAALSNRSTDMDGDPIALEGEKRGSPEGKDWYTFSGVTISKVLSYNGSLFRRNKKKKGRRKKEPKSGSNMDRDF